MEPASFDRIPEDVLIVEDDPIIALDFEETILGFGVKTVRTAASVAKALEMIAGRAPDFALLDIGLVREKVLRSPSGWTRWKFRLSLSPVTAPMVRFQQRSRASQRCRNPIRPTRCTRC